MLATRTMDEFVADPEIGDLDTDSQKKFLTYWRNLKGASDAPLKEVFDVLDLAEYASNLTILSVDEVSNKLVCSLSGSELIEFWGADFTGATISELKEAEGLVERMTWVVQNKKPYFYTGMSPWAPKNYRRYSVISVPFTNEAGTVVAIVTLTDFPKTTPPPV